jgi:hypothetical protein
VEFPGCFDEKKALINSGNNETNSSKTSVISGGVEKTMFEGANSKTNSTKNSGIPKRLSIKKQ